MRSRATASARLIGLAALLALTSPLGCGEPAEYVDTRRSTPPTPSRTELGVARYPSYDTEARPTWHSWLEQPRKRAYRVGYAHGFEARLEVAAEHERFARSVDFAWTGKNAFRWRLPRACNGREWTCIYPPVKARSLPDLAPLLARLEPVLTDRAWTTAEAAAWLLDFVQRIPYRLPTEEPFGIHPPALVASEDWGDCDSKSLLLMILLDHFGIDSVLLLSERHAHAMLGVAVPTGRERFEWRGRSYALAETTSIDAPLGWRHPRLSTPDDWRVVPIH